MAGCSERFLGPVWRVWNSKYSCHRRGTAVVFLYPWRFYFALLPKSQNPMNQADHSRCFRFHSHSHLSERGLQEQSIISSRLRRTRVEAAIEMARWMDPQFRHQYDSMMSCSLYWSMSPGSLFDLASFDVISPLLQIPSVSPSELVGQCDKEILG